MLNALRYIHDDNQRLAEFATCSRYCLSCIDQRQSTRRCRQVSTYWSGLLYSDILSHSDKDEILASVTNAAGFLSRKETPIWQRWFSLRSSTTCYLKHAEHYSFPRSSTSWFGVVHPPTARCPPRSECQSLTDTPWVPSAKHPHLCSLSAFCLRPINLYKYSNGNKCYCRSKPSMPFAGLFGKCTSPTKDIPAASSNLPTHLTTLATVPMPLPQ